ncbi:Asp-tRNA(Asn)/Glu-tRNA(Gln) amidotransferase subunit GatC [Microscilla marina]|uniref:Aspartyl/glutamyl-tRNA(Asn/Gln) amidotransferase subunit C n=1 Tax=Microscilla marina ATCC 23134 TaxID=313606 RepID=A1ZXZ3_MICM2|nr:Asp-tRNA(Asn)/Glu-tRNA(Gln) amidotransferase subunit GatC [Microscilla marina]EAY24730.1 glutamyl-tRNA(Gln) amidotransferase subunit C [Microscilla marina ATCC 23134]
MNPNSQPNVDRQTLHKIAQLARLDISATEEEAVLSDLNQILDWVEKLKELDTEGVEPLRFMSGEVNNLREDSPNNALDKSAALKLAPKADQDHVLVPKVLNND